MKTLINCKPFSQRIEEMALNWLRELEEEILAREADDSLAWVDGGLAQCWEDWIEETPSVLEDPGRLSRRFLEVPILWCLDEGTNTESIPEWAILELEVSVFLARTGLGRAGGHLCDGRATCQNTVRTAESCCLRSYQVAIILWSSRAQWSVSDALMVFFLFLSSGGNTCGDFEITSLEFSLFRDC